MDLLNTSNFLFFCEFQQLKPVKVLSSQNNLILLVHGPFFSESILKVFSQPQRQQEQEEEKMNEEEICLQSCKHPNFVELLGTFLFQDIKYFILKE